LFQMKPGTFSNTTDPLCLCRDTPCTYRSIDHPRRPVRSQILRTFFREIVFQELELKTEGIVAFHRSGLQYAVVITENLSVGGCIHDIARWAGFKAFGV